MLLWYYEVLQLVKVPCCHWMIKISSLKLSSRTNLTLNLQTDLGLLLLLSPMGLQHPHTMDHRHLLIWTTFRALVQAMYASIPLRTLWISLTVSLNKKTILNLLQLHSTTVSLISQTILTLTSPPFLPMRVSKRTCSLITNLNLILRKSENQPLI